MISARFAEVIDPPWMQLAPVNLGHVPLGKPTPQRYVLVDGDGFRVRCDIHASSSTYEELQVWGTLLVIGHGCAAYCVDLKTHATNTHRFNSYFGHIYTAPNYCLVASGQELLRLGRDGTVLWRTNQIALDGVIVNGVSGGTIHGEAEWDPPGGWRPFEVSLVTGTLPNQNKLLRRLARWLACAQAWTK